MKKLLLIRHAKSSWDNIATSDFERPLNDRGKRDAPMMAKRLLNRNIDIDAFVSSPAKRARKTAELFIEEFKKDKNEIILVDELYAAVADTFFDIISAIPDQYSTIAVFSHNQGITDFSNMLTTTRIDDMPTCSIFAVDIDIQNWKEFKGAKKNFWFFDYPKSGL
jgi:phosphohistidine phosphatase